MVDGYKEDSQCENHITSTPPSPKTLSESQKLQQDACEENSSSSEETATTALSSPKNLPVSPKFPQKSQENPSSLASTSIPILSSTFSSPPSSSTPSSPPFSPSQLSSSSLSPCPSNRIPKKSSLETSLKVQQKLQKSVFDRFGNQTNFITKQIHQTPDHGDAKSPQTKDVQTPNVERLKTAKSPESEYLRRRRSVFEQIDSNENDYETWKRNRLKNNKSNQIKSPWKRPGQKQRPKSVLSKFEKLLKENTTTCATAQKIAIDKKNELEKMNTVITNRELLLEEEYSKSPAMKRGKSLNDIKKYAVPDQQKRNHSYPSRSSIVPIKAKLLQQSKRRPNSFPSRASYEHENTKCFASKSAAAHRKEELEKMNQVISERTSKLGKTKIVHSTAEIVAANKADEFRKMKEALKKRDAYIEQLSPSKPIKVKPETSENLDLEDGNSQWKKHVIIFHKPKKNPSISSSQNQKCTKVEKINKSTKIQKMQSETNKKNVVLQSQQCPKSDNVVANEVKIQKKKDTEVQVLHEKEDFQLKHQINHEGNDSNKFFRHPILSRISLEPDENVEPEICSTAKIVFANKEYEKEKMIKALHEREKTLSPEKALVEKTNYVPPDICSTAQKIAAHRESEMQKMMGAVRKRASRLKQENSKKPQTGENYPLYKRCSTANAVSKNKKEEIRKMNEAIRKREAELDKLNQSKLRNHSDINNKQDESVSLQEESNAQWKKFVLPVVSKKNLSNQIKNVEPNETHKSNLQKNVIDNQSLCLTAEERRLAKYISF